MPREPRGASRNPSVARRSTIPLSPFGRIVSSQLEKQGVTATDLAATLSIHPTTLWRWMRSAALPRGDHVHAVARALGVEISAMFPEKRSAARKKRAMAS